jgi:hypothetical protein
MLLAQTGTKDKETALTWVLTGDSITHGAWFTNGARSYPEHLAERVRCVSNRMSSRSIPA